MLLLALPIMLCCRLCCHSRDARGVTPVLSLLPSAPLLLLAPALRAGELLRPPLPVSLLFPLLLPVAVGVLMLGFRLPIPPLKKCAGSPLSIFPRDAMGI